MRMFTAARGGRVRRAAWRRPLEVTDLGAFGPKVLLLPSSAQNTPPGCICGGSCTRRKPSTFFFYRKKKVAKKNAPSGKMRKVFRPLRRATRAPPWTCRPLKRAALNFRPFVTQWLSWVLPGALTALGPKRKIASYDLAMGDFNFSPSAAFDSRHDPS